MMEIESIVVNVAKRFRLTITTEDVIVVTGKVIISSIVR